MGTIPSHPMRYTAPKKNIERFSARARTWVPMDAHEHLYHPLAPVSTNSNTNSITNPTPSPYIPNPRKLF